MKTKQQKEEDKLVLAIRIFEDRGLIRKDNADSMIKEYHQALDQAYQQGMADEREKIYATYQELT